MAITRETSLQIQAPPEELYDLVADITRTGEFSPENQGGEWLDGAGGPAVGARFKATNKRKGKWTTTCTVTVADRGRELAFIVGKPAKPSATWRYRFEAAESGTTVTEAFELRDNDGFVNNFLTKLGTGVSWAERPDQLLAGMKETLTRLKAVAEQG